MEAILTENCIKGQPSVPEVSGRFSVFLPNVTTIYYFPIAHPQRLPTFK